MLRQEVASKYAHALFLATKEKGLIDTAYKQFNDLEAYLEKDPTLLNFLNAPQVLDEHKYALVNKVFLNRMERLFVELLIVLIKKHRIAFLHEIIDEFTRLVETEKGIGRATVITAVPLSDHEKQALTSNLAKKTGLKIHLEEKIDQRILGGLVVKLHDEVLDDSVRRRLDTLKEQLAKIKVV